MFIDKETRLLVTTYLMYLAGAMHKVGLDSRECRVFMN